jgi:hypothetical protein
MGRCLPAERAAALLERSARIEDELTAALERWETLEARRGGARPAP